MLLLTDGDFKIDKPRLETETKKPDHPSNGEISTKSISKKSSSSTSSSGSDKSKKQKKKSGFRLGRINKPDLSLNKTEGNVKSSMFLPLNFENLILRYSIKYNFNFGYVLIANIMNQI